MQVLNGKLVNEDLDKTEKIQITVTKTWGEITNLQQNYTKQNEKITYIVSTLDTLKTKVRALETTKTTLVNLDKKIAQKFLILILINLVGFSSLAGYLFYYCQNNQFDNKNKSSQLLNNILLA